MVKSAETGLSIEPFPNFGYRNGANSPPSGDFRANLDTFSRINIFVNNVGIVETGNVVESTGASSGQGIWARHPGLLVCGEFAICLCDNEGFDTCNDRRSKRINRKHFVACEDPDGHAVLLLPRFKSSLESTH
jgi:hypothetical protein